MKFQIDHLDGLLEQQLNYLAKIANLTICRAVVIETDNENAAALIQTLLEGTGGSPVALFMEPEPEPEPIKPASKDIIRACTNCGEPFNYIRKDQIYCSKPECQKAKQKKYQNQAKWQNSKAGSSAEASNAEAPLPPKIHWKVKGQILNSGQLAQRLVDGLIPLGTLIEHSTRGMFRIVRRLNGRLAPEQISPADPQPGTEPPAPAAPGETADITITA